jgi:hypothetical protein
MPHEPAVLTFLRSTKGLNLTKVFDREGSAPAPHAKEFSSKEVEVTNILELYSTISKFSRIPSYALFTGRFAEPLVDESRANRHDSSFCPAWLCLDFDGLEGFSHKTAVDALAKFCPELATTSYVVQFSASSGIKAGLRAHLFYLLEEAIDPGIIQQWLWTLNFKTELNDRVALSKSMNALHMPLDPLLGQNSRIIFIQPPIFRDGRTDPHPADSPSPRVELVQKDGDRLPNSIFDRALRLNQIDREKVKKYNELGREEGLKRRQSSYFSQRLVKNPTPAKVTDRKEARGFVYVNLNGGDSWGYFYPKDNPEILHNFKGEPDYLLKNLDPYYWEQHHSDFEKSGDVPPPVTMDSDTVKPVKFAFYENVTGKLHWARIDPVNVCVEISDPQSRDSMTNWLRKTFPNQRINVTGLDRFRVIWDPKPSAPLIVDFTKKIINLYQPSKIQAAKHKKPRVPKTIETIIRHALNNPKNVRDLEYERFLDWMAFIVQKRERTEVAWLVYGGQGTGKGVVYEQIMAPLIGEANSGSVTVKDISEKFTDLTDNKLLLLIDEVSQKDIDGASGFNNRIKNWITQPRRSQRSFRSTPTETLNYLNIYLASNEHVPLRLEAGDRRFNVAPPQSEKLEVVFNNSRDEMMQAIDKKLPLELPQFLQFLLQRKVTKAQVSTALNTDVKQDLIRASQTATDRFFASIETGDTVFWDEQREEFETAAGRVEGSRHVQGGMLNGMQVVSDFNDLYDKFIAPRTGPFVLTKQQLETAVACLLDTKGRNGAASVHTWLTYHGKKLESIFCPNRELVVKGLMFNIPTAEKQKGAKDAT